MNPTMLTISMMVIMGLELPKIECLYITKELKAQEARYQNSPNNVVVSKPSSGNNLELTSLKQLLGPKRQLKPVGNDIATGRKRSPRNMQKQETLISGYEIGKENISSTFRDEETAAVARELHEIADTVPNIEIRHIPNIPDFHIDPEEDAINQRITEVARQLAETSMRREYEAALRRIQLPHYDHNAVSSSRSDTQETSTTEEAAGTTEDYIPTTTQKMLKSKSRKSVDVVPLVGDLPQESSQLQLVGEIPSLVPHYIITEGFHTTPELIGPLLGGPPLTSQGLPIQDHRMPKSMNIISLEQFYKMISSPYNL